MSDFLKFIDELRQTFPVHLEIEWNKHTDWTILVYKKALASEFPDSPRIGDDAILCQIQDCDMELVFAKAHVEVKKWLMTYRGYY